MDFATSSHRRRWLYTRSGLVSHCAHGPWHAATSQPFSALSSSTYLLSNIWGCNYFNYRICHALIYRPSEFKLTYAPAASCRALKGPGGATPRPTAHSGLSHLLPQSNFRSANSSLSPRLSRAAVLVAGGGEAATAAKCHRRRAAAARGSQPHRARSGQRNQAPQRWVRVFCWPLALTFVSQGLTVRGS